MPPAGERKEEAMDYSKRRPGPTETERRLRGGQGEEIVVLQDGDPLEPAHAAEPDWDWDGDAVTGDQQCAACGAWGPVFHLEDGSKVCAACAHGATAAP